MTIQNRLRIIMLLPAFLALLFGVALLLTYRQGDNAKQKTAKLDEIVSAEFETTILTFEYFRNPEKRIRTQWQLNHDEVSRLLEEVGKEHPEDSALAASTREGHQAIQKLFLLLLASNDKPPVGKQAAVTLQEYRSALVDQLQIRLREVYSGAISWAGQGHREIAALERKANVLALIFFMLLALVTGIIAYNVGRSLLKSVEKLARGSVAIGDGLLGHQVENDSSDELGKLTQAFNEMSRSLAAAEATRTALESQLLEAQKMEAVVTLAGGVAHEFNNLLAMIFGNVALARQDLSDNPEALLSLAEIDKAAERAKKLVEQILSLSRRQTLGMRTQPLRPAVEETLRLMRATLPAGVELAAKLADSPLPVRYDATQIGQVLRNLCDNAGQSLTGKVGRIEIGLERVELDVEAAQQTGGLPAGSYARLWVGDQGCGMDEATLAHIFEPFYTTKTVGQGTGLGLAVAYGIVKAHLGAIKVSSALDKGTTVSVYLPIVATSEIGATPAPQTKPV